MKKLNGIDSLWILTAGLFLLVTVMSVCAEEYPTLYRGVRPLGMGGAFTAVADDENALFYNPAGLADISTLQVGVFNPLVDVSENTLDMISDAQDTDFDDTGEVTEFLRDYVGEHQHFRAALFPHVGFNIKSYGIMVAGLAQATLDVDVRNPVWPEAHVDAVTDIGLMAGVGLDVPVAGLKAGANVKLINRESLDETYTAIDIAADDFDQELEDDMESGSGIGFDVGVIYQVPYIDIIDLDLGLTVQNVPEMDMGDAKPLETQANFGLAVKKKFTGFDLVAALDYMDLSNSYDEDDDPAKRLHMGVEARLPTILSVRAGLNQGYYTAGATVDFKAIRFDVATYGEEVGAHAGQREDRRYIAQITIGW